MNAVEIEEAITQLVDQPFDPENFPYSFLEAFGNKDTTMLEQSFNSLEAQREACIAYISSQKHEGWVLAKDQYDDGGFSGGSMERPGLKRLLSDISAGKVQTVIVYKVDLLTRSLADFAKIIEVFDSHNASFVSVSYWTCGGSRSVSTMLPVSTGGLRNSEMKKTMAFLSQTYCLS